jgi:hypothetical protein
MGKHIVGRESRKEGRERARIYSIIQCSSCGAKTYERKQRKIKEALQRACKTCRSKAVEDRAESDRTQREQDLALITSIKSIQRLLPRTNRRRTHGLSTGENQRTYKIWIGVTTPDHPPMPCMEDVGSRSVSVGVTFGTSSMIWALLHLVTP